MKDRRPASRRILGMLIVLAWFGSSSEARANHHELRTNEPSMAAPDSKKAPTGPSGMSPKLQRRTDPTPERPVGVAPERPTGIAPVTPTRRGMGQLGAKPGTGDPQGGAFKAPVRGPGQAGPRQLLSRGFMGNLQNCQPAANCYGAGKPCYLEISQGAPIVSLVGIDGGGSPVQQKAAYRIRLCTDEDDGVCDGTSSDQRLNYNFFNYADPGDPYVLNLQLSTNASTDTGPYQEVGPQNFFGVVCLDGDQPCRIAWQYCELPPNDPSETQ